MMGANCSWMRLKPRERFKLLFYFLGRSVCTSVPLQANSLLSSSHSTSLLRKVQTRMIPAKGTPTLKLKLSIRHSVLWALYNNDVPGSWILCLFIWLLWALSYYARLWRWVMFRSVLPNFWSLISLVNPA